MVLFVIIPHDDVTATIAAWAGLIVGAAAAAKLLWHPRSPFRRTIFWFFRRLVGDPLSARAATWGEGFVNRVVTPQIDAVRGEVHALAERNDVQHAENAAGIAEVKTAVADTNAKLAKTIDTMAQHLLTNPPLPRSTGNERRRSTDFPQII